jgi:hypothetical protein
VADGGYGGVMAAERDWRQYERQIFDHLKKLAGEDSEVQFDQSVPGYLSEVERQVDVFVRGRFAGQTATGTMAVDCKCWSKKVDVMDVDRFVGTIEDIRTDFGPLGHHRGLHARSEAPSGERQRHSG